MKLGVYSDIHGDIEALMEACQQAKRLGCCDHVCCGDLVDELHPAEEIVSFVRDRGIACIRGNHERWLLAALRDGRYRHPLSAETIAFLEALPQSLGYDFEGIRVAIHHARPGSDMNGLYEPDLSTAEVRGLLAEAGCDVLLVGHTHEAVEARHPGGGLVANPGALGLPPYVQSFRLPLLPGTGEVGRPETVGSTVGSFGVLELPSRRFRTYSIRVDR